MMTVEFRQRSLALFDELVDLPIDERTRRLALLQQDNPAMHAEVRALIAADDEAGVLEHSPATLLSSHDEATDDNTADAFVGQRIGAWQIVGIVGRGGMGAVYRGERADGDFRQEAAVKLIRMGMDLPELRQRFLRERQILANLHHRNIATLLDGGVSDGGAPYFAMELVDGAPIDAWCDAHALDVPARAHLFLQVCAAVQHAHQNLIVHRDLKPANILVTDEGQAKLLDFGIAKLLQDDVDAAATRDRLLTPEFAAPEQLRGEAVTTATDVYALGVVLFGLLAGGRPFKHGMALAEQAAAEPESPSHAALRLPATQARARGQEPRTLAKILRGDLDAIVRQCLQSEPARRYPSVEALGNDLKAWLEGRPVAANRGERLYRLRKFASRHRWGVAAGVAALLAISGALAVALWQAGVAHEQAAVAQVNATRAEASAARALATRDFLVRLIAETDPLQSGKGTQLTAIDLLKSASQRVDGELSGAPDSQAELRVAIGTSLFSLGAVQDARTSIDQGIAQMRQLHITGPVLANALYERSSIRRQTDDSDGAEADARGALAELGRVTGDQRLLLIKVRSNLATIAATRGRLQEALTQLQAVLDDRRALLGAENPDTAVDWNNLGNAYLRLDRYPQAEAAFVQAAKLLVVQGGPEHPRMVWLHLGIAAARSGQADRIGSADAEYDTAERIMRKALGPDHPIAINLDLSRANLYARRGDYPRAEAANRQALALARAKSSEVVSQAQAQLGLSLLQQGRVAAAQAQLTPAIAAMARERIASEPLLNRMQSAHGLAAFRLGQRAVGEREIRDALARLQAADLSTTEDYAEIASDLATVLDASGQAGQAMEWRQRAHAIFVQVYGADHPRTRREQVGSGDGDAG